MDVLQGASLGWLLAGVFLGWLGNWLFDMVYRRDGRSAGDLTGLQLKALHADIDRLQSQLAERDARLEALHGEIQALGTRLAATGDAVTAAAAQMATAAVPVAPQAAARPAPRATKGRRQEASGKA